MTAEGERPAHARELLLLFLLALAILAPGISSLPPIDRDEPRYAVATTQMLQSHNFIDIHYQNQPRYLQPAGIYWLQAIPTAILSAPEHRHIWTYRLPSLLGAALASLITAWAASLMFGRRIGLSAGVLLAACMSLAFEARVGKTDAALLVSVAVAQFALMRLYLDRAPLSWKTPAAFWAGIGAGVLLKGPIILLVVGATLICLTLWDRRAAWLQRLRPIWGVPLALLIAAPWYIAIGVVSAGRFFQTAIGHSLMGKVAAGQQAHGAPFGYHLIAFPMTFWPGSLLAVMAAPFAWRERRDPAVRFLLCWIVPSWIVFEAVKTKLPHYTLPLFPAIACLTALALYSPRAPVKAWVRWVFFAFLALWVAVSGVLGLASPIALKLYESRLDPVAIALSLASLVSVGAMLWFLWRRRAEYVVAAVACAGFFTTLNVFAVGLPHLDRFWLSPRATALAMAQTRCPDRLLVSTPYHEPSFVFLNGPAHTYLADTPEEAADALKRAGSCGMALVGAKQEPAFLRQVAADALVLKPAGEVQGRDYADNRTLDLTLYLPATAAAPPAPVPAPGSAR